MKKAFAAVPAAAVLSAVAALAVATSAPSATHAAGVDCGKQATIGYFGPTTGPAASIGEEIRRFSLLYAQEWNSAG
jgi:ABC-type branched-subunit amino acid transport system substrate-binding protein